MKTPCSHPVLRRLGAALVLGIILIVPSASAGYPEHAEEVMDFMQTHLYDPSAGLYRPEYPLGPKSFPYDFMWGNGVQFTALVGGVAHNPDKYRPLMDQFAKGIKRYWDADAPIPGFDAYHSSRDHDDKYYDDNAWLVLGFVEAYELTGDKSYLDWARETQKFVLSGWDEVLGGGIYWHQAKNAKMTCSNAPSAAAALRLYFVGGDKDQLEWAKRIREWTKARFQDTDSLFWDNQKITGEFDRTKWTYNTALMIRTDILLYQATRDRKYLDSAKQMADASLKRWADPKTGGFANDARFNHLLSESLLRLYDVTKVKKYLNAVRKDAAFAIRYVRDPDGGYHTEWRRHRRNENRPKLLIENAATARLFWLLVPYPDPDELVAAGHKALAEGNTVRAEELYREAAESDAEAVEARVSLWNLLKRSGRTSTARFQESVMREMAEDPAVRHRLEKAGWTDSASSGNG